MAVYDTFAELQAARGALRGGHRARRLSVAARRAAKSDKQMKLVRELRSASYDLDSVRGVVAAAERAVVDVKARQARLEADIATMRSEGAEQGKVHPDLVGSVTLLAEMPAMIAAAQARVPEARARYEAAVERHRLAQQAYDRFTAEDAEPEPELEPEQTSAKRRARA